MTRRRPLTLLVLTMAVALGSGGCTLRQLAEWQRAKTAGIAPVPEGSQREAKSLARPVREVLRAVDGYYAPGVGRVPRINRKIVARVRPVYRKYPDLVPQIIAILESDRVDWINELRLVRALGEDAAPAIPLLIRLYLYAPQGPGDGALQALADEALDQIGRPTVRAYIELLRSGSPDEAWMAAFQLELPPLLPGLSMHPQAQHGWPKEGGLPEIVPPEAYREFAESPEAEAVLPRVLQAVEAGSLAVSADALFLLPVFGVPAEEAVPRALHYFARSARRTFQVGGPQFSHFYRYYGAKVVPPMIELAQNAEDPLVRLAAVRYMVAWIESPRNGAATALGPGVWEALRRIAIEDPDMRVRDAALQLLHALHRSDTES